MLSDPYEEEDAFLSVGHAIGALQPIGTTQPLERIGNPLGDGGYVMASPQNPGEVVVYSYGLGRDISFDRDLADRGFDIYMYDHTVPKLEEEHSRFHHFVSGVGTSEGEGPFRTIEQHMGANGHLGREVIVKMDIEGAEWDVLDEVPESLLSRWVQFIVEFHGLQGLADREFLRKVYRVWSKLNRFFDPVHVHANNVRPIVVLDGQPVPPIVEVSWLRKGHGRAPWRSVVPTSLDAPNTDRPDHVLGFFPFLPTDLSDDELRRSIHDAHRRAGSSRQQRISARLRGIPLRGREISAGKRCRISSLSKWSTEQDASRAAGRTPDGSFAFHTDLQRDPWWVVDLGAVSSFDEIVVYNRLGPYEGRAHPLVVESSADQMSWETLARTEGVFGGADGRPFRVCCPATEARFVRLTALGETALHLDAVHIYEW